MPPLALVAERGHASAGREEIALAEIAYEPFSLLRPAGSAATIPRIFNQADGPRSPAIRAYRCDRRMVGRVAKVRFGSPTRRPRTGASPTASRFALSPLAYRPAPNHPGHRAGMKEVPPHQHRRGLRKLCRELVATARSGTGDEQSPMPLSDRPDLIPRRLHGGLHALKHASP